MGFFPLDLHSAGSVCISLNDHVTTVYHKCEEEITQKMRKPKTKKAKGDQSKMMIVQLLLIYIAIQVTLIRFDLDKELCSSYQYMLAVFPGISDLREIVNDTAIEYLVKGNKLNIRFCSVRTVPAQPLEIFVTADGKAPVSLGKKQLPALNAGKVCEVTFDLPEEKISGMISGSLNGEKFTILPVIR